MTVILSSQTDRQFRSGPTPATPTTSHTGPLRRARTAHARWTYSASHFRGHVFCMGHTCFGRPGHPGHHCFAAGSARGACFVLCTVAARALVADNFAFGSPRQKMRRRDSGMREWRRESAAVCAHVERRRVSGGAHGAAGRHVERCTLCRAWDMGQGRDTCVSPGWDTPPRTLFRA